MAMLFIGPKFKRHTTIISPLFRRAKISAHADTIIDCTDKLLNRWRNYNNNPTDIHLNLIEQSQQLLLTILGFVAFDYDLQTLDEEDRSNENELTHALCINFKTSIFVARLPMFIARIYFVLNYEYRQARMTIDLYLQQMIDQELRETAVTRTQRRKTSLIASLVASLQEDELFEATKSEEHKKGLSQIEVMGEMLALLSAGYSPTSAALVWFMHLMSKYPQVQSKLKNELVEYNLQRLSVEQIDSLTYLDCVIRELFRFVPPIVGTLRTLTADDRLSATGVQLSKGDQVFIPFYNLGRDSRYWSGSFDLDQFHPERFLIESNMNSNKTASIAFGGGHRQCIGQDFARLELKAICVRLMQHMSFGDGGPDVNESGYKQTDTILPKHIDGYVTKKPIVIKISRSNNHQSLQTGSTFKSKSSVHIITRAANKIHPKAQKSIELSQNPYSLGNFSWPSHHSLGNMQQCYDAHSTLHNHYQKLNHPVKLLKTSTILSGEMNDIREVSSNENGTIYDHHRPTKKKTKKNGVHRFIIAIILLLIISGIILIAVLVPVLTKFGSGTKTELPTTHVLRWKSNGITVAGLTGLQGNTSYQLMQPKKVFWKRPNILYIADYQNNRVQRYEIGSSSGTTVAGDGSFGSSLNQLYYPSYVTIDSNDEIIVADTYNNRVQLWSTGSTSGIKIAGTGVAGNSLNQLQLPTGVSYDSNSNTLYIADYTNDRVMRYLYGASNGTIAAGGNGFGITNIKLWRPAGLYFDSFSNNLLIANANAQTIVQWPLNASNWTLVAGCAGTSGNNATLLNYPMDVVLDPMGNIYVADRNNHRIQLFMNGQTQGITIAGVTSMFGSNDTLLNLPFGVTLDNQLNLYVADTGNHRIQQFLRY
ncbi:unnamed protein product [Rotaria socialis]|uniref:Cytochrome P450 n=1 Tax=Rotaria socialis TaxID=392032 RepID=A0A818JI22_9BILA|nr:unnamed protein product [Rotaria socialis]